MQADWQEVWHSPQPPCAAVCFRVAEVRVDTCFMDDSLLLFQMTVFVFCAHIDADSSAEHRSRDCTEQTDGCATETDRLRQRKRADSQQNQKNHRSAGERQRKPSVRQTPRRGTRRACSRAPDRRARSSGSLPLRAFRDAQELRLSASERASPPVPQKPPAVSDVPVTRPHWFFSYVPSSRRIVIKPYSARYFFMRRTYFFASFGASTTSVAGASLPRIAQR